MNTAAMTAVEQRRQLGPGLSPMLRRARQVFWGVVSRDPRDICLRELPDGTCQVVAYPDENEAKRLVVKGLLRGADGVVVVAAAANWTALLGSSPAHER